MAKLLSKADHARIADAIAAAEAQTSGELYCVVAQRVSDYRFVPIVWAGLTSLLLPAVIVLLGLEPHRWPIVGEPWWTGSASEAEVDNAVHSGMLVMIAVQALTFAIVFLATLPQRVRLLVTPKALKRDRVHRAAMDQFLARGMQRTRERTGVLIFAALSERLVEVVADEGIYSRVAPAVWNDAVAVLVVAARQGRIADGFVDAIALCSAILAEHFPPRPDDINELPDRVVEL
jgi:putative membrane protein